MYWNEIYGGLLIGLASAIPLLYEGRIAGISGYASTAMRPNTQDAQTGLALVFGIFLSSFLWMFVGGHVPQTNNEMGIGVWIVAGLLVGFGSRLGGGCTSGHGVCGLGRLSPRSFASVLIFMASAMLTQFLMRNFV